MSPKEPEALKSLLVDEMLLLCAYAQHWSYDIQDVGASCAGADVCSLSVHK